MKTYWDYTETERAKLTYEQVEKLLAYELMAQGVLMVEPPKVEEVQPVALATRRVFMLVETKQHFGNENLGLAFDTIEQAEAARDAVRYRHEAPWNGTPHVRPVRALAIVSEEMPDEAAVTASKAVLEENKRRVAANEAAKREYEEASKKVADATAGIWSDWHECLRAEVRRQKIRDTLTDYRRMTEGNETMARSFLGKAFPADEIDAAVGPQAPESVEAAAA
jgi:hypothetical protein